VVGWHFEQEHAQLNSEQFPESSDALSDALGRRCCLDSDQAKAQQSLALRWSENLYSTFFSPSQSTTQLPIERL